MDYSLGGEKVGVRGYAPKCIEEIELAKEWMIRATAQKSRRRALRVTGLCTVSDMSAEHTRSSASRDTVITVPVMAEQGVRVATPTRSPRQSR